MHVTFLGVAEEAAEPRPDLQSLLVHAGLVSQEKENQPPRR